MSINAVVTIPEGTEEDWAEMIENTRWTREQVDRIAVRLGRIEKMLGALCWYLLPRSDAGSLEPHDEILRRLGKLEAWVEVVMRRLATLGLESWLIRLDEARDADYEAEYFGETSRGHRAAPAQHPC